MKPGSGFVVRVIYAVCLLIATLTHATTIWAHGIFWDYGGVPWPSAAFWTLLTIVDPAAALLLFLRPRTGLTATAGIIVIDVVHNVLITFWLVAWDAPFRIGLSDPLVAQMAFLVFVGATIRTGWADARPQQGHCGKTLGPS